jgi:hypothetical protein
MSVFTGNHTVSDLHSLNSLRVKEGLVLNSPPHQAPFPGFFAHTESEVFSLMRNSTTRAAIWNRPVPSFSNKLHELIAVPNINIDQRFYADGNNPKDFVTALNEFVTPLINVDSLPCVDEFSKDLGTLLKHYTSTTGISKLTVGILTKGGLASNASEDQLKDQYCFTHFDHADVISCTYYGDGSILFPNLQLSKERSNTSLSKPSETAHYQVPSGAVAFWRGIKNFCNARSEIAMPHAAPFTLKPRLFAWVGPSA